MPPGSNRLHLRIIVDHSCVEVFTGTGEVLSTRIYRGEPPEDAEDAGIYFLAFGGAAILERVTAHELGSAWEKPVGVNVSGSGVEVGEKKGGGSGVVSANISRTTSAAGGAFGVDGGQEGDDEELLEALMLKSPVGSLRASDGSSLMSLRSGMGGLSLGEKVGSVGRLSSFAALPGELLLMLLFSTLYKGCVANIAC